MADVQPSDKPIAARAYAEREATRSRSASRSPGRRRRGTSSPLILLPLMMTDPDDDGRDHRHYGGPLQARVAVRPRIGAGKHRFGVARLIVSQGSTMTRQMRHVIYHVLGLHDCGRFSVGGSEFAASLVTLAR